MQNTSRVHYGPVCEKIYVGYIIDQCDKKHAGYIVHQWDNMHWRITDAPKGHYYKLTLKLPCPAAGVDGSLTVTIA